MVAVCSRRVFATSPGYCPSTGHQVDVVKRIWSPSMRRQKIPATVGRRRLPWQILPDYCALEFPGGSYPTVGVSGHLLGGG